ncbi:MAG: acyltransferase [Bacteroidetes bacterium]|nr:acyltransferase [Bacteroidota bacterium]
MNSEIFIHETTIVEKGCSIGARTKVWHFSHLMGSAVIGADCNIGQNVFIADGVIIGNNNKIQNNVSVYSGVVCEDDVFLGPSMVFTNVINPRSAIVRKNEYAKTLVKKGASIGANATLICGIEIGKYAMIGAGAVVTKDVKDYALLIGNPATQIGWVSEYGHRLVFDENGNAVCKDSQQEYKLVEDNVIRVN